ncbi:MAG: hypothetical protein AAB606_02575 [Patescibacteria group bacterium]
MCLEKFSPFSKMLLGALIGVVLGIVFGLLFGLLIAFVSMCFGSSSAIGALPPRPMDFYQMASFMGMGAGAIVGAILGGIAANHKK